MNKSKKNKKIFGISIIEALVSTAIIGIGFVAILQMTNYSVQSIQTSGERTKANYLTNVIAEDVLSIKKATTGSFSNFLIIFYLMNLMQMLVHQLQALRLQIQVKYMVTQTQTLH